MAAKLTEIIKREMLEGFSQGKSLLSISKEYGCTPSTVTRAVKSFLNEEEFARLKNNRIKNKSAKLKAYETNAEQNSSFKSSTLNCLESTSLHDSEDTLKEDSLDINHSEPLSSVSSNDAEAFTEIIPLNLDSFTEEQKEVACKPLDSDSLPSTLFMLINKNNELESKPLKEFSDWSFLPEIDQNRLVIPLYSNHRTAKRICSRNQKVLKVPNSNVFLISLPYLISKGITRLIMDESLISLDS